MSGRLCCNWDHLTPEQGHQWKRLQDPLSGGVTGLGFAGSLTITHPAHPGSQLIYLPARGRYEGDTLPALEGGPRSPRRAPSCSSRSSCASLAREVSGVEPTCPLPWCPGLAEHGSRPPHTSPSKRKCVSQPAQAAPGIQGLGLPLGRRG